MKELIFLIEEAPEGGYTARALGAAIFTEADDLETLRERIRDAVRCHFDEDERPTMIRLHSVKQKIIHGMKAPLNVSGDELVKARWNIPPRFNDKDYACQ